MSFFLAAAFILINLSLGIYTAHILLLTVLFVWKKRFSKAVVPPPPLVSPYPRVTVQLPIFNEASVLERLLDSIAALEYPRDRLQIQILDDSTDDTTSLAQVGVERLRAAGLEAQMLHRVDRTGFKAGALQCAMDETTGEFLAIFDADFVPQRDFLLQTVPTLVADPTVGFVQARWGHLNRDYSAMTKMQSLAIDSHFLIDQQVRYWAGFLMHFNGTAGVWRKQAITTSGGWHGDTLCEDLDLSYRAQLQGWKPGYLPELKVPAELTPQLAAFKQQQFRWAKGSIQCWRKLWTPLSNSSLPWWKQVLARVHLSSYMIHPLMLLLVLVTPPFGLSQGPELLPPVLWYFTCFTLAFPFFYAVALRSEFGSGWARVLLTELPMLLLIGTGMAASNSIAVFQGLTTKGGSRFGRTPKFNVVRASDRWEGNRYRLPLPPLVIVESLLALYCFGGVWQLFGAGRYLIALSSLYYGASFALTAGFACWEARKDLLRWWAR